MNKLEVLSQLRTRQRLVERVIEQAKTVAQNGDSEYWRKVGIRQSANSENLFIRALMEEIARGDYDQ